jgi:hypothetical protein
MRGSSRTLYQQHPNTRPEAEVDALAAVYRMCFSKARNAKEDAHPGVPDARKEDLNVSGKPILHQDT